MTVKGNKTREQNVRACQEPANLRERSALAGATGKQAARHCGGQEVGAGRNKRDNHA